MNPINLKLSSIGKIDNHRKIIPWTTLLLLIFLVVLVIWFLKGGSFRLYASVFFGLYYLTGKIWISVLLVGIIQNIVFLPLRFIGLQLSTAFNELEDEINNLKSEKEQYFLFNKKVKEGNASLIFYIFSFFVNAIAFISAGRLFLIDFYAHKLDPNLLYDFIPYPKYPLQGTDFYFPFFKITETLTLPWSTIIWSILSFLGVLIVLRLLWRFLKFFLSKNKKLLYVRIQYNRLLIWFGGFAVTFIILLIIFLRDIPTGFQGIFLIADLTRQNTPMNFITAIGTFITTLHAGHIRHNLARKKLEENNISPEIIKVIYKEKMKQSFNNAIILGVGAFLVTNQIPCAFELSVATFEVLYIISPYTFDLIINRAAKKPPVYETAKA